MNNLLREVRGISPAAIAALVTKPMDTYQALDRMGSPRAQKTDGSVQADVDRIKSNIAMQYGLPITESADRDIAALVRRLGPQAAAMALLPVDEESRGLAYNTILNSDWLPHDVRQRVQQGQ
jgi:hypothetical protein